MAIEGKIREIAESLLESDAHFLVDVKVGSGGSGQKVRVLLDGDEGVSIDDCAGLSRALAEELEEQEIFSNAYTLEVSTPGVDFPLATLRQYRKNLGRSLRVNLVEGKDIKGTLVDVDEEKIVLEKRIGKGKKAKEERVEIPLSDINKSIVQISFK